MPPVVNQWMQPVQEMISFESPQTNPADMFHAYLPQVQSNNVTFTSPSSSAFSNPNISKKDEGKKHCPACPDRNCLPTVESGGSRGCNCCFCVTSGPSSECKEDAEVVNFVVRVLTIPAGKVTHKNGVSRHLHAKRDKSAVPQCSEESHSERMMSTWKHLRDLGCIASVVASEAISHHSAKSWSLARVVPSQHKYDSAVRASTSWLCSVPPRHQSEHHVVYYLVEAMAQAWAKPRQARILGFGSGLGFLKPKPDEGRPKPWVAAFLTLHA
ncbi:hypothetical protein B0H10DRAFT_2288014 [Mycena sp. CBHHK59/15]|nr:hypothetical protein B0H10DRAFT_2288014 [Mycena sp. CBHHK59/15]